jgi:peptide deformylase
MKMELVSLDNPILYQKAEPVEFPNRDLSRITSDMLVTMMTHKGCGLAAPQVGLPLRLIMFRHEGRIGTLVNPSIGYRSPEMVEAREGCLSFKGRLWKTQRAKDIRISYQNIQGKYFEDEPIEGFLAVILQHEVEHTLGILVSQHGKEIEV